jgi:hypothetical protein
MAKQVMCLCGRRFHVGNQTRKFQCRNCGRWWTWTNGWLETALAALFGELGKARSVQGDRQRSRSSPSRGRQTNRRRPSESDRWGSLRNWFGL